MKFVAKKVFFLVARSLPPPLVAGHQKKITFIVASLRILFFRHTMILFKNIVAKTSYTKKGFLYS